MVRYRRTPLPPRPPAVFIPEDALAALVRAHLGRFDFVFVAPDIPPGKLSRARDEHALHLPGDEPVVALFDATTFGSARDGFLLTPSRICWKDFLEPPRSLLWEELVGAAVVAQERDIEIDHGRVPAPWTDGGPDAVCELLLACRRHRRGGAPYRDVALTPEAPTPAQTIVRIARRHLGERAWVHYGDSIPPSMGAAAIVVHAPRVERSDQLLVLYDDTVFGSGNDGLVLTERGVCWRGFLNAADAMDWSEIVPENVAVDGDVLHFDAERTIDLRMRPGMARLVANALLEIAAAVGRSVARVADHASADVSGR